MSGTTYQYIATTGVIVPNTETLLTTIQGEWQGVFGVDMNVDSSTPQGVMISAETTARANLVQNNAALANQINPNFAAGIFLDAVAALSGLERSPSTYTVVGAVAMAGVAGSPIAAGSLVMDTNGNQFALTNPVTLDPVLGTATGIYTAVVAGSVGCATGVLTITTAVLGLETVTNPGTALSLGSITQSDESFRALRRNTLALQSISLRAASLSALSALPGVLGVQSIENNTNITATISGITLVAKSIWFCIDGGLTAAIGATLLNNKSYGAAWNGVQAVTVVEPASGQSYVVKYDLPTLEPIVVQITCSQGAYQGTLVTDVPAAVFAFAANQLASLQGFVVGQNASPFQIASALGQQCPGIQIAKIQLSLKASIVWAPTELIMAINQKATLLLADVSVIIGT